ncbi:Phage endolysin [Paramixta manurensis]|uniref:Lysozyme n=1 Tax=Paramixta manurensis TaxID=2740817 RepID=A0A6M8UI55_9GAMM|nr:Phage endolysin [Erwiniaceae bacterium PD-1]
MAANYKGKLSAAVLTLILAGAPSSVILDQFLKEKEGRSLVAYSDAGNVWTICGGVTRVNGKPVVQGMRLTEAQCDQIDRAEQAKALAWVDRNVHVPLTGPQKAGIASFCPWNIGPGNCLPSTFYRKLNAGDRTGACAAIKTWIYDRKRDCRIRSNNCFGQVVRREQESELTCFGLNLVKK